MTETKPPGVDSMTYATHIGGVSNLKEKYCRIRVPTKR